MAGDFPKPSQSWPDVSRPEYHDRLARWRRADSEVPDHLNAHLFRVEDLPRNTRIPPDYVALGKKKIQEIKDEHGWS